MPRNLSAVKRVQIASRNRLRNKKYKSSIKTMVKKTLESISILHEDNNNMKQVQFYISQSYSVIDKAIKKGIIPKNQGSRKKSMLSRELRKNIIS
uniref:ribosomal protein S20 n=1 Tax=Lithothamnion corallioides TaxID=1277934 RepID=UPI0023F0A3CA|nr:ribosomal protein S20 [Lithothamnion corallioides]WEA77088.1 ribosomal protein S20 [Lithothamnion corallioides]